MRRVSLPSNISPSYNFASPNLTPENKGKSDENGEHIEARMVKLKPVRKFSVLERPDFIRGGKDGFGIFGNGNI